MIYPKEVVENSPESYYFTHSVRSRVIYVTLLISLILLLCLLPFIRVDVGIRTRGVLRPQMERMRLHAPVTGVVEQITADEKSHLNVGEPLLQINSDLHRNQLSRRIRRRFQLKTYLKDLSYLIENRPITLSEAPEFASERYHLSFMDFHLRLTQGDREIRQTRQQLSADRQLAAGGHISRSQLEESRFHHQQAKQQKTLLVEQQFQTWLKEKEDILQEKETLDTEITRLRREIDLHTVQAPVSGYIQRLTAIEVGSLVHQDQLLAELVPDTGLVAEIEVSPEDIGLISPGMPVQMQIDTYDYHHWGTVTGVVDHIPEDADEHSNQWIYRVYCTIDQTYLELQNGYRGALKKGMTLQARLMVTERTLLQLLYDQVDDWLNPVSAWIPSGFPHSLWISPAGSSR